ncbi:hypothetical protein FE257_008093 [Aspergillus nanangensis]|uniref:O-methyltransferase domain-containing protein n=1 Tax=Aspergillus nanangensis TaxID=2582783 RepID=A0AAD4CLV8_ASPNN|nr:hypothetical protein FE257_008093 [Aspergillus nanangensis]
MGREGSKVERLGSKIAQYIRQYNEKIDAGEKPEDEALKISSACQELDAFVTSPESWTNRVALAYNSSIAICLLLDMNIFQLISEGDEPTSLDTLVERSGCSKSLLRCVLRECVAKSILDEPTSQMYQLNRQSACLLDINGAAWIHYLCDVGLFTGAHLSKYVAKNGGQIPVYRHETAFQMAHGTHQPFYTFFKSCDPKKAERFDKAMQWSSRGSAGTPIESIFDFSQLRPGAVVVDVGGGRGHNSLRIAKAQPHLSFIIQDLGASLPAHGVTDDADILKGFQWQQHDFYNKQPVKGADLYFLACIMMDNTSEDCCNILEHLVEAMIPNKSILLIDDAIDISEDDGYSLANPMNMHLLACFGTLSRTMEEWKILFSKVPHGLCIINHWIVDPGRVTFALQRTS